MNESIDYEKRKKINIRIILSFVIITPIVIGAVFFTLQSGIKSQPKSSDTKYGFTARERLDIFKTIVFNEREAGKIATSKHPRDFDKNAALDSALLEKKNASLFKKLKISQDIADKIAEEGLKKGWLKHTY